MFKRVMSMPEADADHPTIYQGPAYCPTCGQINPDVRAIWDGPELLDLCPTCSVVPMRPCPDEGVACIGLEERR